MGGCRRLLFYILVAAAESLGGCSTWRMLITLKADADTNHGRPLQVVVRTVPVETYRSEPYTALARLVTQPDKSVLRLLTIDPQLAYRRRLLLTAPADAPVAIYFLYESQIGSWKMFLPPRLPWTLSVPLGRNGVRVDEVRECRFGRW
jgi:hypothetical protein